MLRLLGEHPLAVVECVFETPLLNRDLGQHQMSAAELRVQIDG